MSRVRAFVAFRPLPEVAAQVVCPPYDVVSTAEARVLSADNPHSFLHVVRPEIDCAFDIDEHDEAVYAAGATNLDRLTTSPHWTTDDTPALFVYRLTVDGRSQTGVFGCVSVADYEAGYIVRHEATRVDKEDDRTRHILAQRAHAEPVMLVHRDDATLAACVSRETLAAPLYDFEGHGVRHTVWRAQDPAALEAALDAVERLYIADGHHRCRAASRAAAALREGDAASPDAAWEWFPAVLFPMSEMCILPYHRVVQTEQTVEALCDALAPFDLRPSSTDTPTKAGDVAVYLGGAWYHLTLQPQVGGSVDRQLDVARLESQILRPILGILDVRTDERLHFVGGIRGPRELERRVQAGEGKIAFCMWPTDIRELLQVSDADLLMPPKSTWFEPKLISGLLVHQF